MQMRTGQDVRRAWMSGGAVFLLSVVIVRALGRRVETQGVSLAIGYVGLAAIGLALGVTWYWIARHGPTSVPSRVGFGVAVGVATLLWFAALIFPFL